MAHLAREISLIVIHHSASDPFVTDWRAIQTWHRRRFKLGIGYHRVIERDGFVVDGRKIQQRGAHAPPNANRLGICVIGWNGNKKHRSWAWNQKQWTSLIRELHYWCDRLPLALVCGHNQTKNTLCPGVNIHERLSAHGFLHTQRLVQGQVI